MKVPSPACFLTAFAAACAPGWRDQPALITEPRIIAIKVDPPEVAPGMAVTLAAVVATAQGPATAPIEWSFCRSPKPLPENGAVHPACVTGDLSPLGPPAPAAQASIPADACRLFGPETPPRAGAAPLARPRDPDSTGGYYQPVRARGVGPVVVAPIRLVCNLASAPLEPAAELRQRYRRNENPSPPEITALVDGAPAPLHALPPGRDVTLVASWSPESAETYLAFDPVSHTVVERREGMRVSWFVTAGTIVSASTGRAEGDLESNVTTLWQQRPPLPSGARGHVWAVLQDSRGGMAVSHRELD